MRALQKIKLNKRFSPILVGSFLLVLLAIVYSKTQSVPISAENLISHKGFLQKTPSYGEYGGDMPKGYISIYLTESFDKYFLYECSYRASEKEQILNLKPGEFVEMGVQKKTEYSYYVNYLKDKDGVVLLSLENYNHCKSNRWKSLFPYLIVLMIVLVIIFIKSV